MIPAIAILSNNIKFKLNFTYLAIFILIPYGFYVSIFNYSRPLITKAKLTSTIKCSDNRFKKYFANNLSDYVEYNTILQTIKPTSKNIGLQIHSDAWEYPLYYPLFKNKNKLEKILVENYSAKYPTLIKRYSYIISNLKNVKTINLKHHTYYNLTPKNSRIWLYKRQK